MGPEGDPLVSAGLAQALLAPSRVGAPVGAHVQLRSSACARDRDRLADRVTSPEEEAPTGLPQGAVEVAQRLVQKGDAIGRGEARAEQLVVEDEQRHGPLRLRGRGKGRVVAHPQIAVEENYGGAHLAYGEEVTDRPSGRDESEDARLD